MTFPTIIFGIILATFYGALFHLWKGGNFWQLIFYILLSWLGFWLGQLLGDKMGWYIYKLGGLHLGIASIISFIFLGIGYWLSKITPNESNV